MSKAPSDLSGILAPKGKATSATNYPGDEPAGKPAAKARVKTPVKSPVRTSAKSDIPAHLRITKPERRADALNIRITPSERERIEALCERLGGNITQILVMGIEALERELGQGD